MKSVNTLLAEELAVSEAQVAAAVRLLDEGATVPFIARYRKEVTGSSRIIYDDLRAAGFRFIDHRPLVADTQNVAKYVARNPRGQNKGGKSE